jgi:hypothetical protein
MRRKKRATITMSAGVLLLLAGCSNTVHRTSRANHPVVAQLDDRPVTPLELQHWIKLLSPTRPPPSPPRYSSCIRREAQQGAQADEASLRVDCAEQYRATQLRALSFLITLGWVESEAARIGATHMATVETRVSPIRSRELRKTFPAADPKDIRFLERMEGDVSRLRAAVKRSQPKITLSHIRRFYELGRRKFERPERRSFDIVEQIRSPRAALRLMTSLRRSGDRIAALIAHQRRKLGVAIHEVRERPANLTIEPPVWHLIFSARPHLLVGPVPQFESYAIVEVLKTIPASR